MLQKKIAKHLKQLGQKKFRKEFEEFVVEGIKGVGEALKSDAEVVLLVVEGNRRDEDEIAKLIVLAQQDNIPVEFCGRKDVDEIKTTDTFPGVLAVVGQEENDLEDIVDAPIICLHEVKDPGNLGTIIRTADWFGIKNILLSEECVDVYNPKVFRSTMGSLFHTTIFRSGNISKTLERLKEEFDYEVNALDMDGNDVSKLKSKNNAVYLFGSESHGVSDTLEELIDNRYTISGKGDAESLNLAISAGIVLYKLSS
ncbi:hypothetical protein C0581_02005 [Candidatus Parcubacteria bacterium]|nr:MAG: hypothetical protein C0581_02005 [Candidatus Parcubacteria bacterium]